MGAGDEEADLDFASVLRRRGAATATDDIHQATLGELPDASGHFFRPFRVKTELVRQAGYQVTVEPKDVNLGGLEVTVAFFKGPCGEILEFFQTH